MSPIPARGVLFLTCPDQKGIVAAVANFIFQNGGNIVHADQHTDPGQGIFFQRLEWELDDFRIGRAELPGAFDNLAKQFGMQWSLHFSDARPQIALFASLEAHCLYDLLARYRMGELQAEIPLVISNHLALKHVADTFGVEYYHFPVTPETRAAQERDVRLLLKERNIEVVVLARYMQVLGSDFVSQFPSRIINIHHSFLPSFVGPRPYHQAFERGVKVIGATAHYVTEELDQGPIIVQDVASVSHRDTVADLIYKGRDLEKSVLARALNLHLARRVLPYGKKTIVFE